MSYIVTLTDYPTPLKFHAKDRAEAVAKTRDYLREKGIVSSIESIEESDDGQLWLWD